MSRSVHPALKIVALLGSAFSLTNQLIQSDNFTQDSPEIKLLLSLKKDLEEIQAIAHKLNNRSI